jgi:hypothetical protein
MQVFSPRWIVLATLSLVKGISWRSVPPGYAAAQREIAQR